MGVLAFAPNRRFAFHAGHLAGALCLTVWLYGSGWQPPQNTTDTSDSCQRSAATSRDRRDSGYGLGMVYYRSMQYAN
jgi:hypothetical protein